MHRMIDTATWDDPWFAELEPDAKLMFLYLLTNRRSTAAGAFEITIRHMAFETGLDSQRIGVILETLHPRVQWWPAHQVIWIRNFFKHQAANDKFTISAQRHVADLPVEIQQVIATVYPNLVPDGVGTAPEPDTDTPDTHGIPTGTGIDTHDIPIPDPIASNSIGEGSKENREEGDGANAPKPKTSRATKMPKSFTLTDGRLNYAIEQGMDRKRAEYQFERMRNWSEATGSTRKDWDAQWRNWVLKDINENGKSTSPDRPTMWKLNASGVMVEVPA